MPQDLGPLPGPIVDEGREPTPLYEMAWAIVRAAMRQVPTEAVIGDTNQSASLGTTPILTTPETGDYEVSVYLQKTVADGVSSSLTVTIGWTSQGQALTQAFSALTTDAVTAIQGSLLPIAADVGTAITVAIAYVSNTPGTMRYLYRAVVKRMA